MTRVLLVEDDTAIAEPLARALTRDGNEVEVVGDGVEAARVGAAGDHDVIVLDVGLPGLDGIEVCRRVRAMRPDVPILMLTARAEEIDAVMGLDAGADDYQTKPFRLAELLARVRAMSRRARAARVSAADVSVDLSARRAWRGARELTLAPREFDLLAYLVANAGRVVRREEVMAAVWDENWFGSTRTLDVHVAGLRRKLDGDGDGPSRITTVRGVGLRFEGP